MSACTPSINQNATPVVTPTVKTAPAVPSAKLPYDYTLDNGLRVLILPYENSPVVMTQIWYRVGSVDEPVGKGGLSHFLEHLMFKKSAGIDGAVYDRVVSYVGGSRNAFTGQNYTGYYEFLPAHQYPLALEIEANRMRGLAFDKDEIKKERDVVKEERRQTTDDDPMSLAYEEFDKKTLPNSPKSRPVIGTMQDIENLSEADLKAWYDTYYQPDNAVLVLVGGVKLDEAKKWVQTYFGNIKNTKIQRPKPNLSHPSHRGYQQFVSYQDVKEPSLVMGYNVPSLDSATTPTEAYGLALFSDIASGGASSRLPKTLVRSQEKLASVSMGYGLFGFGDDVLTVSATPREGVSLDEARDLILQEIETIKQSPINDVELTRGQVAMMSSLILKQDSMSSQARSIASLAMQNLPQDTLHKLPNELKNVKKSEILAAAKKYLTKDNLTVMYVLPKSEQPKSEQPKK